MKTIWMKNIIIKKRNLFNVFLFWKQDKDKLLVYKKKLIIDNH